MNMLIEKMAKQYKDELEAHYRGIRVVCFDFNGTLAEYDGCKYPAIGKPVLRGITLLTREKLKGSFIVISTCRLNERLLEAEVAENRELITAWLEKYDLLKHVDAIVGDKPYADVYVDDRAYNPFKKDEKWLTYCESLGRPDERGDVY